ncbi:hypothetical protein GGR53DRAFT_260989 [Hypoxylon sp. FL1150]|nr:hypothetical protein GGR53DRAFT_260989 [Hypoxylon sp. FL1150]
MRHAMANYRNPHMSYNHDVGAAGLDEIEKFAIICEFSDNLRRELNILDDTVVTTPELPFSLPILPNDQVIGSHQDGPWNASRVGGSPNLVNKGCQSQWHLSWWLVRKINVYRLALQGYDDLRPWLEPYQYPKDIINDGSRALEDIFQRKVPDQFDYILCAMIVQQAIYVFARKRNLFKEFNESAFISWRDVIPTITTENRNVLDLVFERLTTLDKSSLEDTATPWPSDPSVSGVGGVFTSHSLSYPMAVDSSSLHDSPQHGHPGQNPIVPSNASFSPHAAGYSVPPYMNQPATFNNFVWDAGNFGAYDSAPSENGNFFYNAANQYPTIQHPPLPPDLSDTYRSSPSGYPSFGAQMSPDTLYRSNSFQLFMHFMNEFKDCGELLRIFSLGLNRGGSREPYPNERMFSFIAKSSFFDPLRDSMLQLPDDPIARAIVSITVSLVSRGELRSSIATADYMIHLGKHLLSSDQSCASFAKVVLEALLEARSRACAEHDPPRVFATQSIREQSQNIGPQVEAIVREWTGTYQPTYLLQRQDLNSGSGLGLRPRNVSRSSSKRPTLSSLISSGSNERSHLNTPTEYSTTHTTNTTPSVGSNATLQCPNCDKSFSGKHAKSHLSRHKRDHRDNVQRTCEYCNKVFYHSRTDNIRTHIRNVHQQEIPKDGRKYWNK